MIYYTFNPLTFELEESHDVDVTPPNATTLTPTAVPQGSRAVWTGSAWTVMPDHRGETWYDQTTGAAQVINTLGTPAANLGQTLPDAAALAAAKITQKKLIDAALAVAMYGTVPYLNTVFQCDQESVRRLNSVLAAYGPSAATPSTLPTGYFWLDLYNNQVSVTYAQLQGLLEAGTAQGLSFFLKQQSLKQQIDAVMITTTLAAAVSAVQSIVW